MERFLNAALAAWIVTACACSPDHSSSPADSDGIPYTGVVYDDANANGVRDAEERGLAGARVSNGRDVVSTDSQGRYRLPIEDDDAVFVIKPSGWQVPLHPGTHVPLHYYLHKPRGSPDSRFPGVDPTGPLPVSLDFGLRVHPEPNVFRIICFGDTQPRDQKEVDYISHDVVEELVGVEAAFGVTLGDLVFDDLAMLPEVVGSVGMIGIPWHHVIGNHDVNRDALAQDFFDDTYERILGPSTYSFDYADVHFIVLNDIVWEIGKGSYHAELTEEQLTFLDNDLHFVPREKLVVLMMHIPLTEVVNKDELLRLLASHPQTLSISAHWHVQEHLFLDTGIADADPHHHIVMGTACGGWWRGQPDELGIPHAVMPDGTPNGYSIVQFDGNEYSVRYKVARRPADYQMNVFAPDVVAPSEVAHTEVIVNFFAGSERCLLELRLDEGDWVAMERFEGRDPGLERLKEREALLAARILAERHPDGVPAEASIEAVVSEYSDLLGLELPDLYDTKHLWKANIPQSAAAGYHLIHVRATDQFGQVHHGRRVIRVRAEVVH